ncbi:MAG: beta-ketoacyl-[acyl-carrier-protein] synthase family protein [Deltaproteobacteria bacterium]|nr:beta-ketoacyl-[acyl-carrier-protein] synthase family protein [Deltaproteobacteria bacterium]
MSGARIRSLLVARRSWPRPVVTGCGAVSPFGGGVEAFWRGALDGRSALAPIRGFDTAGLTNTLAGEVPDGAVDAWLSPHERARRARIDQFALAAAREALSDARLDLASCDPTRIAVIVATTLGAMPIGEAYLRGLWSSPPLKKGGRGDFQTDAGDAEEHLANPPSPPLFKGGTLEGGIRLLELPYAATATTLARALDVRGPVLSPSIACASGTQAIGQARELIQLGHADVVIAGGAEALCHFVVAGFNCLRATTATAVRPFDARRDGLALGEGAALVVVESDAHARRRGVAPAIEVAGTGLSSDAVHMTAPARDGAGAARAMRAALADADLAPCDVDAVSAHGTGTVYNDAMEMAALAAVFGAAVGRLPVNGIKGAIGHTLGAAGSFEAILCLRMLRDRLVPPTAGCEQLDPACRLDLVRGAPRPLAARVALSTSSAFAGNNAAIVLRRTD